MTCAGHYAACLLIYRSRKDGRLNLPVAELAVEPRLLYSERQQRETLLIFISGSSLLADD